MIAQLTFNLHGVSVILRSLYFELFDSNSIAWGWGDPHITTLDGGAYTFNGWGEYVLLQFSPPNNGNNFTIQGRMVPWNMTSATKYSAFAFGGSNQPTVEVNNRSSITCNVQCLLSVAKQTKFKLN